VEFIIDTGADLTVVPTQVADNLRLWDFIYEQAEVSGVGSSPENRWLYLAKVIVAGKEVFVTIDARSDFSESLLGRDVLNEFRLTLSAPENIVRLEVV
jgi:predicted aspartyl protease